MRNPKILAGGAWINEVYTVLSAVGEELEKMNPDLFERVGRQIGCTYFTSEQRVTDAFTAIAHEILHTGECNWAKIIVLYAIAGGLAVDCVRQGKHDYISSIRGAMTNLLENDLVSWIQANGGWVSFDFFFHSFISMWFFYKL